MIGAVTLNAGTGAAATVVAATTAVVGLVVRWARIAGTGGGPDGPEAAVATTTGAESIGGGDAPCDELALGRPVASMAVQ